MTKDETIIARLEDFQDDAFTKKPCLTFIKGSRIGEIYDLHEPMISIGRSSDCTLRVEDNAISRQHFKIICESNAVFIEDAKSTNGTFVNGQSIGANKVQLRDGDKIQISRETILEFSYLDETKILSEKKRYEMGVLDPVTNIYNKRYLLDRLSEEFSFAKRREAHLTIAIFDIDHFKVVNDTYGHLAGDAVLQKIAELINGVVRSDDLFARYGGEEFVIMMRDTELHNAIILCERLREMVSQLKVVHDGREIVVTISVGIATLTAEKDESFVDLIARADQYLYRSKKQGRNRVSSSLS